MLLIHAFIGQVLFKLQFKQVATLTFIWYVETDTYNGYRISLKLYIMFKCSISLVKTYMCQNGIICLLESDTNVLELELNNNYKAFAAWVVVHM